MAAKRPQWIVSSLAEVARFFRVHAQTPRAWRQAGMPGRANHWDLSEILRWREGNAAAGADMTPRDRLLLAQAELTELRRAKLEGSVVDVEAVRRVFVEHVSTAKALLDCVPEQVLAALPPSLGGPRLREIRDAIRGTIDATCTTLADALAAQPIAEDEDECEPSEA